MINNNNKLHYKNRPERALSINKIVPLKGLRVIDLGCRAGHDSFNIAELGARQNYNFKNVFFTKSDARFIDQVKLGKFDLCLCSGLLYHMINPFNLLKRIRNICNILMLETHIAPSSLPKLLLTNKNYRDHLTIRKHQILLDGEKFLGRFKYQPKNIDIKLTAGSYFFNKTFWLDEKSLLKALSLAGFEIKAIYYKNTPKGYPIININYGPSTTKIFIYAIVKELKKDIPVQKSKILFSDKKIDFEIPSSLRAEIIKSLDVKSLFKKK